MWIIVVTHCRKSKCDSFIGNRQGTTENHKLIDLKTVLKKVLHAEFSRLFQIFPLNNCVHQPHDDDEWVVGMQGQQVNILYINVSRRSPKYTLQNLNAEQ